MAEDETAGPTSQLPYDDWTEEALRLVVVRALQRAGARGLPGDHHFYITFRTDHPAVAVPARLKAQYPEEITIVLQHQFWDLVVDEAARLFSVGLSFGGVPTTLRVPLEAVTGFADPYVKFGLRFRPVGLDAAVAGVPAPEEGSEGSAAGAPATDDAPAAPQVVSLDAFRRRSPSKES